MCLIIHNKGAGNVDDNNQTNKIQQIPVKTDSLGFYGDHINKHVLFYLIVSFS